MKAIETAEGKEPGKLLMCAGLVALVLVVLGAAGWTWREKPTFCNAVCHRPMDRYVQGYYGGDSTFLISAHAEKNVGCLDCHEPEMSQQLVGAARWATGDYSEPLKERKIATRQFCTRNGCHIGSEFTAATEGCGGQESVNPHESHQGDVECFNCHSMHGTSSLMCNSCHDWRLPDGWQNGPSEN